ncbi:hypothetical protein [Bacillus sp. Brlt_9]|uniref:hypothetical protein n=1 Tax=Bacillus sp. Brlt_9 TaxID=3110916 RepID=UPI003F7BE08B
MKIFKSLLFMLRLVCLGMLIWLGITRGSIIYWLFSVALLFFTVLDVRRGINKSKLKAQK